ncbi:ERF family protein [Romboutsia timonensis]|uniref:ERF family protein n=1 Tax=Romboutsia timonensis TaxID=1776391 RepID=UPI0023F6EF68|nr:ERF family protein [Romboutsia timonensis]
MDNKNKKEIIEEVVDTETTNEEQVVVEKVIIKEVPVVEVREKIIEREVPVEKVITEKEVVEVEVPVEIIKEVGTKVNFDNANEVAAALANFNLEMENIAKNAKNPFFKSSYLDLSAIANTVRPLLAKHGLSVIQYPIDDENGRISVNTVLLHKSGQKIEFPGIWVKPSKLGDVQVLGSIITYLKRYSIAAILFVAGCEEDDDGEKAVGRGESVSQATQQTSSRGASLRSSRL